MKLIRLVGILTLLPLLAQADCDSSLSPDDKIRDVKKKLACFESEVAELKRQLIAAKEKPASSGIPRISMAGAEVDYKSFSVDACKSRAIIVISTRGGKVIAQGDEWVDFELQNRAIMINCRARVTGYVITAGDMDAATEMLFAEALRAKIFP